MKTETTYRILQLVNHDEQFEISQKMSSVEPVILNKFDLSDPNFLETLRDKIFSDGSATDFIARCQCGEEEGNSKIGMYCQACGTEVAVSDLLDNNNMICKNWLSAPDELKHGWLQPKLYLNIARWLSYDRDKRNYIDDILDTETPIPFELRDVITDKGFTYLYDNFDRIIEYFCTNHPVISLKPETKAMRFCLEMYRDRIFCRYIPILNSAISPIVSGDSGNASKKRYSDVTADHIIQAAVSLSRLTYNPGRRNKHDRAQQIERISLKAFRDIVTYYEESTKKYISTKKAIPRTHIFGNRCHYSFRGVVVPITEPHLPWELHIPWKMAVNGLRVQISNRLFATGLYTTNQVAQIILSALQTVDERVGAILDDLLRESPFPQGIPCIWTRPPSIRDGSVMLKFCSKIKRDIDDSTIGITPVDAKLPNVDQI